MHIEHIALKKYKPIKYPKYLRKKKTKKGIGIWEYWGILKSYIAIKSVGLVR